MLMLVALSAIILPLILLVLFRLPARIGMPIAAGIVLLLAIIVWHMAPQAIAASTIQGLHRAVTIAWILFGALLFLYAMQITGLMQTIKDSLSSLTVDRRVLAVLIAFIFVSMLEGVAGFGTPAAIVVPLLITLGFKPLVSVVIALIGDSVAVSFGAVATPLFIGLSDINLTNAQLSGVVATIVRIDFLFALFLPLIIIGVYLGLTSVKNRRTLFIEMAPWSLMIGGVYGCSAIIVAGLLGPSFVAIIASSVTLCIALITIKAGFLLPRINNQDSRILAPTQQYRETTGRYIAAWLPYALIVIFLIVQRGIEPIRQALLRIGDFSMNAILGYDSIYSNWYILLSPGSILLLVALGVLIWDGSALKEHLIGARSALSAVGTALLALAPTLIMIQIFANSGLNAAGLSSMPEYIALAFASTIGPLWVIVAPCLGLIASFITGSSTVSNLTMAPIQYNTALDLGLPVEHVLAQQVSGANAGNMFAVHNVVAALTTAKLPHFEWRVIRITAPIALIYLSISTVSAIVLLALYI